jgi:peptidoglycan/LPS O-acetylase OafA/YrhL
LIEFNEFGALNNLTGCDGSPSRNVCRRALDTSQVNSPAEKLSHFDYIDSLRGLAILGVIGTHTAGWMHSSPGMFKNLLNYGLYGVQLFFVASALTLSYSWNSRSGHGIAAIRDFALRRFFRIAPLYCLAIVFYLFFEVVGGKWAIPGSVLDKGTFWHFCFLHGLHPIFINTAVPGGWTIGVEMLFYICFPFLISFNRSLSVTLVSFVASVFLALVAYLFVRPWLLGAFETGKWDPNYFFYWLPNQLPVFMAGIVAYHAIVHLKPNGWHSFQSRRLSLIGCVLAVVTFASVRVLPLWMVTTALGISFGLLAIALSLHPWRLMVNRGICEIGRLSYSMYLVHWLALVYVTPIVEKRLVEWTDGWVLHRDVVHFGSFLALVGTSTLLAWITNRWIEKPGIRLGQYLILRAREMSENHELAKAK